MTFDDIRDEPFLALPQSAGPLRDYWLAGATNVVAEINDTEETYEAVAAGIGVCLLAAGNAPIFARGDVTMLEVTDLSPAELVLAWHERHCPPLLERFVNLVAAVSQKVVFGTNHELGRRGDPQHLDALIARSSSRRISVRGLG